MEKPNLRALSHRRRWRREYHREALPTEARLRFLLFADLDAPRNTTTLWRAVQAIPERYRASWKLALSRAERGEIAGTYREGKRWLLQLDAWTVERKDLWAALCAALAWRSPEE